MISSLVWNFVIAAAVFAPLERLLPRRREQRTVRPLWGLDTVYALLGGLMIVAGMGGLFTLADMQIRPLLPEAFLEWISGLHIAVQVIAVIVIADLGYYWIHRLAHTVPALWRFHAIHHSIEEMDWLAAHRVHPLDQIATRGLSMMVPIALGFAPEAVLIFSAFHGWHSYLKHSNVKIGWGPLRWIIGSPMFHHWHHANHPEAIDKNFAGQLPILDILFGTALMKEREAPTRYGTDTPVAEGFLMQLVDPLLPQAQPAAMAATDRA